MPSDATYRCRVCGVRCDTPPWDTTVKTPLFEFCVCCGVEHGYQDCTPAGARRFREQWIESGGQWDVPSEKPAIWEREAQLRHVPKEFR